MGLPRVALQRIVLEAKEREMAVLQRRLNGMLARLGMLAEPGQSDLRYLADIHDRIRRSRETCCHWAVSCNSRARYSC